MKNLLLVIVLCLAGCATEQHTRPMYFHNVTGAMDQNGKIHMHSEEVSNPIWLSGKE